jgi:squalene synthase HpnC
MHATLLELSYTPALPETQAIMSQAGRENFPVAARVLSRKHRERLLAVYGFARLADDLGDELAGDRLAALDWLELELDRAYAGEARNPLMSRLQSTLADCPLPRAPFVALIDANRLDQRVSRYETWEQLRGYCALSANPVGELVLHVFSVATAERIELSDRVCTALQLIEHLQDLQEDLRRGRAYLPAEDLARFGCSHEQLSNMLGEGRSHGDWRSRGDGGLHGDERLRADGRLREVIRFEADRAHELLQAGRPLVKGIAGRPKLAVGAFVAGGDAALTEIGRAGFDVLGEVRRARRPQRLRALIRVLRESRR